MSRADHRTTASPGGTGVSEEFWEEHYRQRPGMSSGRVNPILAEVAATLTPGSALDLGCGEGSDALWLAGQGWRVTPFDVSARPGGQTAVVTDTVVALTRSSA